METIELKIKGMNCSGCSGRIYRVLSQYDGVIKSSVDYKNGNATVNFDEQKISENEIKVLINKIGFAVVNYALH